MSSFFVHNLQRTGTQRAGEFDSEGLRRLTGLDEIPMSVPLLWYDRSKALFYVGLAPIDDASFDYKAHPFPRQAMSFSSETEATIFYARLVPVWHVPTDTERSTPDAAFVPRRIWAYAQPTGGAALSFYAIEFGVEGAPAQYTLGEDIFFTAKEAVKAADEAIAAWCRRATKAISAQTMHHRRNLRQFEKAAKVRSGAEGSDKPVPPHPDEDEDSDD